jgi:hypothetical protein
VREEREPSASASAKWHILRYYITCMDALKEVPNSRELPLSPGSGTQDSQDGVNE